MASKQNKVNLYLKSKTNKRVESNLSFLQLRKKKRASKRKFILNARVGFLDHFICSKSKKKKKTKQQKVFEILKLHLGENKEQINASQQ